MRIDILTIFPNTIEPYLHDSILLRAQQKGVIELYVHQLRDWAHDKHKTVDDTPYGGGPGMVMRADVIRDAVLEIKKEAKTRIILFSPAGKTFTQEDAQRFVSDYSQLILICGRYEGVDERVEEYIADETVSVGDFVLSGGELPALVVADTVCRLVPGVLGDNESEESRRYGVGVPQYTKPESIEICGKEYTVPDVLKSGNHAEIEKWRKEHKKV